ncbi:uncharacterized protein LOC108905963 isoform X2 [Anoplophora glabripennis]|uniref:uncharacterized protein LOC108905963 isoform X2 n=1 Tax=Anoplophora glabripennis TaxID=217634 RepID=UPI0008751EA7|nr:uncharacterized protein LOC108905963 isoform X2 [Anoplophora glabripennis]
MSNKDKKNYQVRKKFMKLSLDYVNLGLCTEDLEKNCFGIKDTYNTIIIFLFVILILIYILYQSNVLHILLDYFLGIRCIIRNNYFVWEAVRPSANCSFCINVSAPIVLLNATKSEFSSHAFTSKPVLIKQAFLHWPARHTFSLKYFEELYNSVEDAFKSVDDECQFLHFKSNFISLRDVFSMTKERMENNPKEKSWYVGWGNCHPLILQEMRKHYPKPHFLPDDSEIPSKEYVFMGYDDGATMHLDFINRLMWQAQLKGSKIWHLHPPPECHHVCKPLSFLAEPGDAVDTRVWYHGTTITPGQFSLSIQSEYG